MQHTYDIAAYARTHPFTVRNAIRDALTKPVTFIERVVVVLNLLKGGA